VTLTQTSENINIIYTEHAGQPRVIKLVIVVNLDLLVINTYTHMHTYTHCDYRSYFFISILCVTHLGKSHCYKMSVSLL